MTWQHRSQRRARLPADWHTRRRHVLDRDQHACQIRGPRCAGLATEVDHIDPGDNHDLANLQAVCANCHRAKSSAEGNAAKPPRQRSPERHPGATGVGVSHAGGGCATGPQGT